MPNTRYAETSGSIVRGAEILKALSDGLGRVSDLAVKLKLSKSTVHRILKSLEIPGLAKQDPITKRYYLGPLILGLASKPIVAHQNLILSAFDQMTYLRERSRETVILHVRLGLEKICLEELQSPEAIRFSAGKGSVAPIYTGSAGKVLMSQLSDNELDIILRSVRLERVGPNTITDKKVLLQHLEFVREHGYASSFGERIPGSSSIAVPVMGYICPVALTILGPDSRFTSERMLDILETMKASSKRISKTLKLE